MMSGAGTPSYWSNAGMILFCDALILRYSKQGLIDNYAGYFQEEIRRAQFPYQRAKALGPLAIPSDPLSQMAIPDTGKLIVKTVRFTAQDHILLARLAVQVYRSEHADAAPVTLDALTQGNNPPLSVVPADPYSLDGNTPLRYAHGQIYSVGENGRDDGGRGDDIGDT